MAKLTNGSSMTSVYNITYTIDKFLASGTQGAVYQVSSSGKKYALKWYSKPDSKMEKHFRNLIQSVPKDQNKNPDKRFVWPQDLIVTNEGFGYTMDCIEMNKYINLHRLTHYLYIKGENHITGKTLCDICVNIAEAFRSLHSSGYCYKDISSNNIVFNVKTGDVLIFDVDNVVVNGEEGEIKGTPKFMAPEVILGKTHPDSQSDRFSLASYFFLLFVGHNSFEGKLRDDYVNANSVMNDAGFKEVFGTNAVFCFHPTDSKNNLNSTDYAEVTKRWEHTIPKKLKEKFTKTFVKGLPFNSRSERTTNKEWIDLFNEFKQNIIICSCGKEYFPGALKCIKCNKPLIKTSKIRVQEKNERPKEVILQSNSILKGDTISKITSNQTKLAEVIVNPKNGELGLKNLSSLEWHYKDVNDVNLQKVPAGNVVTLKAGRTIAFVRGEVQVMVL